MAGATQSIRFRVMGYAHSSERGYWCVAFEILPPEKANRFAAVIRFPATTVYGSCHAVLDDENVDAVYVRLPMSQHLTSAPMSQHLTSAALAAQKKKHVHLEKPTAMDLREQICESSGVQFMDTTMWIHRPRTLMTREFSSQMGSSIHDYVYSVLFSLITNFRRPDHLKQERMEILAFMILKFRLKGREFHHWTSFQGYLRPSPFIAYNDTLSFLTKMFLAPLYSRRLGMAFGPLILMVVFHFIYRNDPMKQEQLPDDDGRLQERECKISEVSLQWSTSCFLNPL